ncbi:uncharacterized protein LOC130296297 [Hyla sarda]|uniref:uncharacterized protein LOC130296297 n=1 Tax=Hyla sarda TaxID=327740 RepID=UPI0024C23B0D|nr:uncharacterized protein LOC130296297 [Hyla sarda]
MESLRSVVASMDQGEFLSSTFQFFQDISVERCLGDPIPGQPPDQGSNQNPESGEPQSHPSNLVLFQLDGQSGQVQPISHSVSNFSGTPTRHCVCLENQLDLFVRSSDASDADLLPTQGPEEAQFTVTALDGMVETMVLSARGFSPQSAGTTFNSQFPYGCSLPLLLQLQSTYSLFFNSSLLLSSSSGTQDPGEVADDGLESTSDHEDHSAVSDMVDRLVSAIRDTFHLEDPKSLDPDPEVSFGCSRRSSKGFISHAEFDTLLDAAWKHPDKQFRGTKKIQAQFPFPPDLVSKWTAPPTVDPPVSRLSKSTTLPLVDAASLKDPADIKIENFADPFCHLGIRLKPTADRGGEGEGSSVQGEKRLQADSSTCTSPGRNETTRNTHHKPIRDWRDCKPHQIETATHSRSQRDCKPQQITERLQTTTDHRERLQPTTDHRERLQPTADHRETANHSRSQRDCKPQQITERDCNPQQITERLQPTADHRETANHSRSQRDCKPQQIGEERERDRPYRERKDCKQTAAHARHREKRNYKKHSSQAYKRLERLQTTPDRDCNPQQITERLQPTAVHRETANHSRSQRDCNPQQITERDCNPQQITERLQPTADHRERLQPTTDHRERLQPTADHRERLQPTADHRETATHSRSQRDFNPQQITERLQPTADHRERLQPTADHRETATHSRSQRDCNTVQITERERERDCNLQEVR